MRLSQLLDMSLVQKLAEANYNANRMPIGIIDAFDGSVLIGCGWQDICVRFHRAHPASLARCEESDRYIKSCLFQTARCEYQCQNGLRDIGIPIVVAGEHLATMFLGQFFYEGETPDRAFFVRQARQFGYDEQAYLAALDRVPVFSREVVDNVLAYDTALSRFIADLAESALETRRGMEQLAAEKERLSVTLASIGDAVIATDDRARVTLLNGVAEKLTGWTAQEAVGRPLDDVFKIVNEDTRAPAESPVQRVLREGVIVGLANHTALVARDGTERPIADSGAPIRDGKGRVLGMVLVFRDQAEERAAAEELRRTHDALRKSEEQLRVATLAAEIGVWSWIPGTSEVTVSANWRRLFGVPPDAKVTFETWRNALHPDDRDRAVRELNEASDAHRDFDTEYRVVRPDGSVRWIVDRGRASYDGEGRPISMGGINIDITERKRAEDALRDADRRKDEFLGMLSHELRNPLAPICNSIFILDNADPDSEQARRARTVIQRQVNHLTRLVDDLLDLTRIARGKIELRRERIDVAEVVRRTADDHRSVTMDRGLKLHVDVPEDRFWVDGDATRLAQVVGNLLQNAAKFTPAGGDVSVAVSAGGGVVHVEVRDSGVGIDPELRDHVFEPFVQAERSLARTQGGLGLGLAMVKGITELHGGTVEARSGGRDKGSTFVVRLPLAAPLATHDRGRRGGNERAGRGRRVLVVDDNRDAAESLADVVEMLGHAAEVAYDGAAAIEKARANPPDVVLCDIGLPGLTGYDVARALRAEHRNGVQIFAVSGYAQLEDRQRAIESGFDGHLAKPPNVEDIERVLA